MVFSFLLTFVAHKTKKREIMKKETHWNTDQVLDILGKDHLAQNTDLSPAFIVIQIPSIQTFSLLPSLLYICDYNHAEWLFINV